MAYILLDESGDLGFSLNKGSSRYFIITIIFVESKRKLEKIVKIIHSGLRKKFKKVGTLHAYKEESSTKRKLLEYIKEIDCGVLAIILNKEKVYTKLQDEKSVLYNYVTNVLLDKLFTQKPISFDREIILIAAQRETNKFLNENFKEYLSLQVKNKHKTNIRIEIATPHKEKSLQAVDFVSWALFRKYTFGDDSYYKIFENKIIGCYRLFE